MMAGMMARAGEKPDKGELLHHPGIEVGVHMVEVYVGQCGT